MRQQSHRHGKKDDTVKGGEMCSISCEVLGDHWPSIGPQMQLGWEGGIKALSKQETGEIR